MTEFEIKFRQAYTTINNILCYTDTRTPVELISNDGTYIAVGGVGLVKIKNK